MTMKKLFAIIIMMMLWTGAFAQTYSNMWKQVSEADRKDLPQQKADILKRIMTMADNDRNYGQWVKASVEYAAAINDVNPDSLNSVVEIIAKRQKSEQDPAARAVLSAVLYRIYGEMSSAKNDSLKSLAEIE